MKPSLSSSSGWISPRSATLALALFGIVFHLNAYSWLGSVGSALPKVPERQSLNPPTVFSGKYAHSAASVDELIHLGAYGSDPHADNSKNAVTNPNLPAWIAEAKAYLKAQGLSYVPTSAHTSDSQAAAMEYKHRWSSAGRQSAPESSEDADPLTYHVVDDGAEDVERMQWDALRLVIGALRWYVIIGVICCIAGVVGVMRSQLLLCRIFVLHSFLDLLLTTLSLLALAIVCTYPAVRSHLCDEFGSGEIQSWFSRQTHSAGMSAGQTSSASDVGSSSSTLLSTTSSGLGKDFDVSASGWETVLDGVFGSENCEESFGTTVVPMFMLFGLLYTALRLQCFFYVQRFYASLLRSKVYSQGYVTTSNSSSGDTTPSIHHLPVEMRDRRYKEDKMLD